LLQSNSYLIFKVLYKTLHTRSVVNRTRLLLHGAPRVLWCHHVVVLHSKKKTALTAVAYICKDLSAHNISGSYAITILVVLMSFDTSEFRSAAIFGLKWSDTHTYVQWKSVK